MRPTKGAIAAYNPAPPPADLPDSARRYLDDELNKIADLLQAMVAAGPRAELRYAAPKKPRIGDVVYADGSRWNPGSGEGYYYLNTHNVWTPLG